jgi:hypothetical protein
MHKCEDLQVPRNLRTVQTLMEHMMGELSTGSGAHSASYSMGGSFPGGKAASVAWV